MLIHDNHQCDPSSYLNLEVNSGISELSFSSSARRRVTSAGGDETSGAGEGKGGDGEEGDRGEDDEGEGEES